VIKEKTGILSRFNQDQITRIRLHNFPLGKDIKKQKTKVTHHIRSFHELQRPVNNTGLFCSISCGKS